MKKRIFILILLIMLTGCSAKYDIYFDENKINDEIKIYEESSKVKKANQKETDEFSQKILDWERGYDYYNVELYAEGENTGYIYTYSFDYDEYDAMTQLRKCYEDFEFTNGKQIKLKTSKEFLCGTYYPYAKDITINISSKYNITNSNADKKDGNTHTWIINGSNYKSKPIEFTIDKNSEYEEKVKPKTSKKMVIILVIFVGLILLLIKRKRHK